MANEISGFGVIVNVVASVTFPAGFQVNQLADDADPVDMQSIQIMDKAMGLNGDLVTWAKATPLPAVLNVIPTSEADTNLQILADANRVGQGKNSARDIITMTIIYPNGNQLVLSKGKLTDAMFGNAIQSSGRQKTKPYAFIFESKTETFAPGL